jgi:hypothetical protein
VGVDSISDSANNVCDLMTSLTRRHTRNLLIAILAMAVVTLAHASVSFASVKWASDAERPWDQEWANQSCQDGTRVKQVTSPVAQGRKAYEIELRDGDDSYGERCELGQGNPTRNGFPLFHEGDERWISFQVYLPDDYPIDAPRWNVFFQLKQLGGMGTPAVSMEVVKGQFVLNNSDNNTVSGATVKKWTGPATRNRWVKFTVHTKFSPDENVGFVELFGDLDGQGEKLLMQKANMHTMKRDDAGNPVDGQARIGMYRDPAIQGTSHIFFDGYTIATSQADAESRAFDASAQPFGDAPAAPASTPQTPAPASSPSRTQQGRPAAVKHHPRRVILRTSRRRARSVSTAGAWPRVLKVYGWVKTQKNVGHRSVVIEIWRNGRWHWLSRGWLRSNGRFYMAAAVDAGTSRTVRLRAHVSGLGNSKPLSARV